LYSEKADALARQETQSAAVLSEAAETAIQTLRANRDVIRKALEEQTKEILQSNLQEHAKLQEILLVASEERAKKTIATQMIGSLIFPTMKDRYDEIPEAHRKTFRWILEDSKKNDFVKWLQSGAGIYWINGKAGSGKSTLMRFLSDNPITKQHLSIWARHTKVDLASFYFWNGGSLEQRSHTGLLRSLLHQVLKNVPEVVPTIFPNEWAEIDFDAKPYSARTYHWSLGDLKAAFKRWLDFAAVSQKVCLFIDGLDEYAGDQEGIAQFFKDISDVSSPYIKICVSSRPWVIFDEAFNGLPGFRLQDLTFNDIQAYVSDKLHGHHHMKQLTARDPELASELKLEIVAKASGVFLWVRLVVISLLDGLRNRDDIEDLKARLRELPSDLSALYTHMLRRVQPLYKQQASRVFQIYHTISTVELQEYRVTALELEMAITGTWDSIKIDNWRPMSESEIVSKCDYLDVYLKSRCAGLLEVCHPPPIGFELPDSIPSMSASKVNYLHRTVKDFLEIEEVGDTLLKAEIPNFEPNVAVIMSYVTRLKRSTLLDRRGEICPRGEDVTWAAIDRAMGHAREAEAYGDTEYVAAVQELEQAGLFLRHTNFDPLHDHGRFFDLHQLKEGREWRRNFLRRATTAGLCSYVEARLKNDSSMISGAQGTPLLTYALPPKTVCSRDRCGLNMVELLLKYGADPNEQYAVTTHWQELLAWIHGHYWNEMGDFEASNSQKITKEVTGWAGWEQKPQFWAEMMEIMLSHGADIGTPCRLDHKVWRKSKPLQIIPYSGPFGPPKKRPSTQCKRCRRLFEINTKCETCDEPVWVGKGSHSVRDVINDAFDRWVPGYAERLRRILEQQDSDSKPL
jgi:hypothetical protein